MGYMLMPSEVARLVYGYINDTDGCQDVAKQFLKLCPHLREFANGMQRGARYSVKINNMTLLDYLNNPAVNAEEHKECNHSSSTSIESTSTNMLNEDALIASITKVITNTLESVVDKQKKLNDQSFQQLFDDREQFKSILLKSLQTEFPNKVRDLVNGLENNIIRSLNAQNQTHSLTPNDILKTPKNNNKHSPYLRHSGVSFSTAAHSSLVNSPRRKNATPRRLPTIPQNSALSSPATSTHSQYHLDPPSHLSNYSELYSSPAGTESSEIDVKAFIDEPSIVNKFLQTTTSDERWPQKIASKINLCLQTYHPVTESASNTAALHHQTLPNNNMEVDISNQNMHIEELIGNARDAINDDSDFNHLLESVTLSTPFKFYLNDPCTPSSVTTSNASLNTPLIPDIDIPEVDGNSSNKENGNVNSDLLPVVKNLYKDLTNPEVTIRHYPENDQPMNSLSVNSLNNSQLTNNQSISIQDQTIINVQNNSVHHQINPSNDDSTLTLTNASFNQSQGDTTNIASQSNVLNSDQSVNVRNEPLRTKKAVSKPVFYNQHLNATKRSFARLKNDQKILRATMNYSGPSEVKFDGKSNNDNNKLTLARTKSSPEVLTTTIDKVVEAASPKKNIKIAPAVHSIDSSMIQISNSQIQMVNQPTTQTVMQQQSGQIYYTTSAASIWDPSTGIAGSQQMILVPSSDGTYTIANIAPQITTTSQNLYYRVVSSTEQVTEQQQASTSSYNMPILATNSLEELKNSTTYLINPSHPHTNTDNTIIIDDLPKRESPMTPNKPSILSKSDSFKKKQLILESPNVNKVPAINGVTTNESPRNRKEPRKSDLGKRALIDDEFQRNQSIQPAITGKRKHDDSSTLKNNSILGSNSKIGRQTLSASEVIRETDKVKTIISTDIDSFLNTVHKIKNDREAIIEKPAEKQQNKRQSSAANEKSRKARSRETNNKPSKERKSK